MARAQAPDAVSEAGAARIRAAAIGDASDVARLLEALGYPCDRSDAAERIAVVLGDPRQHLLIAEIDGEACGLVALDVRYSRGADQARVTALIVAPACSRQGIGRRLLREVESISRRAGVARIEVTSNAGRHEAHAFYHGCGYADGSRHFFKLLGD